MLIGALNLLFMLGFGRFAWNSGQRASLFLRSGWQITAANAGQQDALRDIWRRRAISEGGRLLLAGFAWGSAALISAGLALYFGVQALAYSGLSPA